MNWFKKQNLFFQYGICFLLTYIIIFIPLTIKNGQLGFSGLFLDGFVQHLLFFREFILEAKDWLFNRQPFSLYDFSIGYGGDLISTYGYYGIFDPFNIIGIILPIKWIEFSFYLIIFMKMFLGGYFFCLFLKKMGIKKTSSIISSSIFYIFNACMITSIVKHPIFIGAFMIYPLVVLGIEKALRKESKMLLVLSISLSLAFQFYFAAYVFLGAEIYLMLRLCQNKTNFKEWFINMVKVNLFILLGLVLASVILLTQMYALTQNGRTSGNVFIMYDFIYYASLILTFMVPFSASMYTIGIGNILGVVMLIAFIIYGKNNKWLKSLLGVEFSFLLISIFGYTFSLFSYVNNRWSFVIVLPICLALAVFMDENESFSFSSYPKAIKLCVMGIICAGGFGLMYLIHLIALNIFMKLLLDVLIIALFAILIYFANKLNFQNAKFSIRNISKTFLILNCVFLIAFNVKVAFTWNMKSYEFYKYYDNEITAAKIGEDGFYRVSKGSYVRGYSSFVNDSIYGDYSSTFAYTSMNNGYIIDMLEYFSVKNETIQVGYGGLNNRYVLETLFGVKYYVEKESDINKQPYNFSLLESYDSYKYSDKNQFLIEDGKPVVEKTNLYINNNALSLGYVYDTYVLESQLNYNNGLERQDAILDSLILEETVLGVENKAYESNGSIRELDYSIQTQGNVRVQDNQIIVGDEQAKIVLFVKNLKNEEVYIELNNLNCTKDQKFEVFYISDNYMNHETNYKKGGNFYTDNSNHLEYMGYYENEESEKLEILINKSGVYTFDSLKVYAYNMEEPLKKIESLQKNQLENIKIEKDTISATLDSTKSGMLFLSIPYSENFKAYVNGVEKDIFKANKGFMAIVIEEGKSEIKLEYDVRFLKEGGIISCVGLGLFVIYICFEQYFKYKRKSR